jgi:integrase
MPTLKLTDKAVSGAKAGKGQRLELWDEQTPGLCLRVSDTGKRVWIWRYRTLDGRQPRLSLGDYSDRFGLKWARGEVEELRVRVRKGEDPAGDRRQARAAAKAEPLRTFNELADAYLTACEKGHWKPRRKQKRARTLADERGVLRRNVRPVLGERRLESIDKRAIKALLTAMMDRGIGAQTNRTHAIIRQVFAYAVAEERLGLNPAAGIDKPATERPRDRVLSDDELSLFWGTLQRWPNDLRLPSAEGEEQGRRVYVGRPLRIALQLAALLLVRRNEVAGMAVAELNLEQRVWIIPGERMKGGQPHLVPLPPRAVQLIREAMVLAKRKEQPAHVFPSPHDVEKPIRPDSVTHAMVGICAALGVKNAAPHDLRRTGSTAMTSERLGIAPFIRSKVLSHQGDTGGGAAVSMVHYDVNTYAAEKRRALEAWEGLLLRIVGERPIAAS